MLQNLTNKMSAKHTYYKDRLKQLFIEQPESKLCKNRYKAIRHTLYKEYEEVSNVLTKERMIDFIQDILYLDRTLRLFTEDIEQEEKKILSQQWQLDAGYGGNIKLKL